MNAADPDYKPQRLAEWAALVFGHMKVRKKYAKAPLYNGHIIVLPNSPEKERSKKAELTGKDPPLPSPSRLVQILRGLSHVSCP